MKLYRDLLLTVWLLFFLGTHDILAQEGTEQLNSAKNLPDGSLNSTTENGLEKDKLVCRLLLASYRNCRLLRQVVDRTKDGKVREFAEDAFQQQKVLISEIRKHVSPTLANAIWRHENALFDRRLRSDDLRELFGFDELESPFGPPELVAMLAEVYKLDESSSLAQLLEKTTELKNAKQTEFDDLFVENLIQLNYLITLEFGLGVSNVEEDIRATLRNALKIYSQQTETVQSLRQQLSANHALK